MLEIFGSEGRKCLLYFRHIISKEGGKQINSCHSIKEAGEFYLNIDIMHVYIKKGGFSLLSVLHKVSF